MAGRIRCIGTPALRNADSAYASASPINGTAASSLRAGRTAVMTGRALAAPPWACRSYPYAQEVSVDGGTDR